MILQNQSADEQVKSPNKNQDISLFVATSKYVSVSMYVTDAHRLSCLTHAVKNTSHVKELAENKVDY